MARYGYVIRMGGAPVISGARAAGMEKGTRGTTSPGLRPSSPEGEGKGSDAVRRVAMMQHTPEEWARMTQEARVIYGGRRYMPRWAERLLVAWAMLCYGISRAYRAQDRVLVSRGYQRERRVTQ